MLLFKVNYRYKLKILLLPQQIKKSSKIAKERVKTLINFYKDFKELCHKVWYVVLKYTS